MEKLSRSTKAPNLKIDQLQFSIYLFLTKMKKNMVEENFCRPTFLSSVLCSNDFQTNKKSKELDAENTKLATAFLPPPFQNVTYIHNFRALCRQISPKIKWFTGRWTFCGGQNSLTRRHMLAGSRGKKRILWCYVVHVCCRDECRRRMVQGEFEVGGGSGGPGSGLPGPGPGLGGGAGGQAGGAGPGKLPASPDSPVSDVNSILAGAHLQVGEAFY